MSDMLHMKVCIAAISRLVMPPFAALSSTSFSALCLFLRWFLDSSGTGNDTSAWFALALGFAPGA